MGLAPEKASRIIAVSSKPLLLIPDPVGTFRS